MIRAVAVLTLAAGVLPAQRPELVRIPAGSFVMGCDPSLRCSEALPKKRVEFVQPFWMSRTETTVKQFAAFVKATGYKTDAEKEGDARTWLSPGFRVEKNQPAVFMTMNDAQSYCAWAGARLPTEAEWEYAARAGSTMHHYWGEEIDDRYLWYRANSGGRPGPVARKRPNAWGLHDVEGNVWEWVSGEGPHTGVTLPGHGSIRGAGWMTCPEPYPPENGVRSRQIGLGVPFHRAPRQNFKASWRRHDSGFRCASSAPPTP
jgi:formylglycine-generating enzyme required for sulfatase activity